MFVASAWVLGLIVVFCAGYGVTWCGVAVRDKLAARSKAGPLPRSIYITEDEIDKRCVAGGILTVMLVVALLIIVPPEWRSAIWIALTVLGVLGGLSTFLLNSK